MYANSYLEVYDGGSYKDTKLFITENGIVKSAGSQMFIIFTTGGNARHFTAKISFGIIRTK